MNAGGKTHLKIHANRRDGTRGVDHAFHFCTFSLSICRNLKSGIYSLAACIHSIMPKRTALAKRSAVNRVDDDGKSVVMNSTRPMRSPTPGRQIKTSLRGRPSKQRLELNSKSKKFHPPIASPDSNPEATKTTKQVLEKVVVPTNSRSSVGSVSSSLDRLSEYDTPITSEAVTPAESLVKGGFTGRRSCIENQSAMIPEDLEAKSNGKRKRSNEEAFMRKDTLLAQRLQQNEYGIMDMVPTTILQNRIDDSEEDHSLSSSLSEVSAAFNGAEPRIRRLGQCQAIDSTIFRVIDDEQEPQDVLPTEPPQKKKLNSSHRTVLPSRAARLSAHQSLKSNHVHQVLESEDSATSGSLSDISMFSSELESEVSDASEVSHDEAVDRSEHTSGRSNMGSRAGQAVIPARRRRRPPVSQATNGNRNRRRERLIEDRVRYKPLNYRLAFQR